MGCGEEVGGHQVADAADHDQPRKRFAVEMLAVSQRDGQKGQAGDGDAPHGDVKGREKGRSGRVKQRQLHEDKGAAPDES